MIIHATLRALGVIAQNGDLQPSEGDHHQSTANINACDWSPCVRMVYSSADAVDELKGRPHLKVSCEECLVLKDLAHEKGSR